MMYLYVVFMGLLQGLTEFLPVSSSGHLSLFQNFFGGSGPDNLFNVLLHFATLLAVCVFYRRDIAEMVMEFFRAIRDLFSKGSRGDKVPPARRLVAMIVLGTLPLVVVLPFKDMVEGLGDSTLFIGCALLVTGLVLFASDRFARGRKTEKTMTVTDALAVGCAQALAVVPGLSRSGSTISAGIACGLDRPFAVRFSFLLSLPAVLGATLLELLDVIRGSAQSDLSVLQLLVGMAVAAVAGYFAIAFIKRLADKGRFGAFAYYCWAAGLAAIVATLCGLHA